VAKTSVPGLYRRGRGRFIRCRTDPPTGKDVSTKCTTTEAAKRWLAKREKASADQAYQAAKEARLDEWTAAFAQHLRDLGRSAGTMNEVECKLGHWVRVMGEDCRLADLGPEAFDRFVSQRLGEKVSSHTVVKECNRMIEVLRFAKRRGRYNGDTSVLKPEGLVTAYVPKERTPTMAELNKLWLHLNARLTAIVVFGVVFGGRRAELLRCTAADDDRKRQVFRVHGSKTAGSTREVPVLSPFRKLIKRGLPGLPIETWNNTYWDLEVACRLAGIEYFTPHDLRRTHASILQEHGVDADVVRRFLGHTTRNLVDRVYGRPRAEKLRELAEGSIGRSKRSKKGGSE
jgi:integrase